MANVALILDFLTELRQHNTREWMAENRSTYTAARQEFTQLVERIIALLATEREEFRNLSPKDCVFRQNRDVRFSADKSPYTGWMSAWFSPGGKKAPEAGYYLRLEPGNKSVLGAGLYQPAPDQLKKIRQEIDYNAAELQQIVSNSAFKQEFEVIQGEKLKRAPKGYEPTHPQVELLKMKSFIVLKNLPDADLRDNKELPKSIFESYQVAEPFVEYLNVAVS